VTLDQRDTPGRKAGESQSKPLPGFKIEAKRGDIEHWSYRDDQLTMFGWLRRPEGPGPFPAILISHGGTSAPALFFDTKSKEMVKWGFVCLGPVYTHGHVGKDPGVRVADLFPGARDFSEVQQGTPHGRKSSPGVSEENIARGSKCVEILASLPYVDARRICAYGNSRGAMLTAGLAAAIPNKLAAVAMSAGGVFDEAHPYKLGGMITTDRAQAIRSPFLMVHGGNDETVGPLHSELLKNVLDPIRVPNERHVFLGEPHGVHKQRPEEVFRLLRDFFTRCGVLPGSGKVLEKLAAGIPTIVHPAIQPGAAQAKGKKNSSQESD